MKNENDDFMLIAAQLATDMSELCLKRIKGKSVDDVFKILSYALSSLIAGFVDGIIKNEMPDKKNDLINDLFHSTKMLIHVKELNRNSNKGSVN